MQYIYLTNYIERDWKKSLKDNKIARVVLHKVEFYHLTESLKETQSNLLQISIYWFSVQK